VPDVSSVSRTGRPWPATSISGQEGARPLLAYVFAFQDSFERELPASSRARATGS
jgi:hypothetical protein